MPVNPLKPLRIANISSRARALPLRKAGATAAFVVGGLLALDLVGFVATVWFGAELVQAAEAAGVAGLLKP